VTNRTLPPKVHAPGSFRSVSTASVQEKNKPFFSVKIIVIIIFPQKKYIDYNRYADAALPKRVAGREVSGDIKPMTI
jgi:hypothetical protein